MNEDTNYVGIDVSKSTFDVSHPLRGHHQYTNDVQGFRAFIKTLDNFCWVVMEATGSYHVQLAKFLYAKGVRVSVANPLVIKRFIQMKLRRNKTDKSDALMIGKFAADQPLELWHPDPVYIEECKSIQTTLVLYGKQRTALKNKLHSLISRGQIKGLLVRSLKRQLVNLQKEITRLETSMEAIVKEHEQEKLTHLLSIPGMGKKTALLLLTGTNGFETFESPKQVSAYLGLAPTERSSGSSVRGRSYISKMGDKSLRNHLFLCSFTACQYNAQCKALYDRLVAKGKSKKLALIAVSNKLIKQAFAISKSGIPYDPAYKSRLVLK
jgi:transposase